VLNRRRVLVGGAALVLASGERRAARAETTETPVIDPEVRAAVARGPARVLVELRLPDPAASPGLGSAPGPAIAMAQEAVLRRLSGTLHRLVRQYTTVPLLALEIGPDALRALEAMGDLVVRVRADRVRAPAVPRSPA
jgi:hypothetical protein